MPQDADNTPEAAHGRRRARGGILILIAVALAGRRGRRSLWSLWKSGGPGCGRRGRMLFAVLRLTASIRGDESARVLTAIRDAVTDFRLGPDRYERLLIDASKAAQRGVDADSITRRIHASALLAELDVTLDSEPAAASAR